MDDSTRQSEAPARPADTGGAGSPRRALLTAYSLLVLLPILLGLGWLLFVADGRGAAPTMSAHAESAWDVLSAPLPRFLLQLLVVLAAAKSAGWLMRRLGQPAVIGEMLAGILLGPSLFGLLLPEAQTWLFPRESLTTLGHVSQLGVLVFMFAAGAEFDLGQLRGQRRLALLVSHTGIALPFLLGLILAWGLHPQYAGSGAGFVSFALFVGVAMSVTAFPVLLRIIEERGYRGRVVATIAVACAALSDVSAWTALAGIIAWIQARDPTQLGLNIVLAGGLAWLLLGVVRPRLRDRPVAERDRPRVMILLILGALTCALYTELIGLHLLFGAFLAGVAVSSSPALRRLVEHHIEPFAVALLLPLFFARTGLDTRIDLLTASEWLLCAAITALATLGKLGGTVLAARVSGMERLDAWRLGALMNTRGLMELIVLALGLQLGLIDQRLYAVLVLVAIITTVMTGPLLGFIDRRSSRAAD